MCCSDFMYILCNVCSLMFERDSVGIRMYNNKHSYVMSKFCVCVFVVSEILHYQNVCVAV